MDKARKKLEDCKEEREVINYKQRKVINRIQEKRK